MAYVIEATTALKAYHIFKGVRGTQVLAWIDGYTTKTGTDAIIVPGGTMAVPGDPNTGSGIDLEFASPTVVSAYGWAFRDGFCAGFLRWQFFGSADRVNFALLSDPGEIWPSGYSDVEHKAYTDMFQLSSPAKYRYYRITIIETMHGNPITPAEIILTAQESEVVPVVRTSWQVHPSGRNR